MQMGVNYSAQLLREKIVNDINESELPPCVIAPILSESLAEIRRLEVQFAQREKQEYENLSSGDMKGDKING